MTCAEALASLRARPARPVQERILAAFSLWKFMEAGGTAEVLEDISVFDRSSGYVSLYK